MRIQLEGELDFMALPDLLQWMEQTQKSAILSISGTDDSGATRSFYFEGGHIIFVSSNHPLERFGQVLTQLGQLDPDTMKDSLVESRKLGICFTQYLIDRNLATEKTLTDALERLAQTILLDVMGAAKGRFAVGGPLPPVIRGGPIRLASGHLILDSLRKLDEATKERSRLSSDGSPVLPG